MVSNHKIFSGLLFFTSFLFNSNIVQSSYRSHYFSNWEVFHIVETKDERGFDLWMSTRPQVNIFNAHNQTPLMIAAQIQHASFVTRLLNAGACKSYVDNFGKTARDYALIAENYYYKPLTTVSSSNESSSFWSAVGVGVAAGLCTYALCALCEDAAKDSDCFVSFDNSRYDYCTKCSSYFGYTVDPLALYCSSCYRAYCGQKKSYNPQRLSRISDRL